jgi:hypothetical protein
MIAKSLVNWLVLTYHLEIKEDGMTAYNTTSFCCSKCKMPLCKFFRSGQKGRDKKGGRKWKGFFKRKP